MHKQFLFETGEISIAILVYQKVFFLKKLGIKGNSEIFFLWIPQKQTARLEPHLHSKPNL